MRKVGAGRIVGGLATAFLLYAVAITPTLDVSGEWSSRSREDTEDRVLLGTNPGDYTGFPLNEAGRQFADHWSASILSLPTQQALPHPAQYIMRGPGPRSASRSSSTRTRARSSATQSTASTGATTARSGWTAARIRLSTPSTPGTASPLDAASAACSS